ncbi:plant-specific domain TIGR01615 family protein [Musa troglodytarum]|uniref:Plant-specific domain TIGR01615 family protein n=1 Tax=Musa troglodytarum TaxID=320322 RepID=A0A9E7L0Z0_9LILI|nr:plant-specific domain TIGR01615 family protein [Musa troglodytarum]
MCRLIAAWGVDRIFKRTRTQPCASRGYGHVYTCRNLVRHLRPLRGTCHVADQAKGVYPLLLNHPAAPLLASPTPPTRFAGINRGKRCSGAGHRRNLPRETVLVALVMSRLSLSAFRSIVGSVLRFSAEVSVVVGNGVVASGARRRKGGVLIGIA